MQPQQTFQPSTIVNQPMAMPAQSTIVNQPVTQDFVTTNRVSFDSFDQNGIISSRVGFEGYCPVSITAGSEWIRGDRNISAIYDNVVYYFASQQQKETFNQSPERFIPALGGDCIVCFANGSDRVSGSVHHTATHQDRIYLFAGETEKQIFMDDPENFAKADLAAGGNCIVSQVASSTSVKGSPNHIVVHNGMRYWFASDSQRSIFEAEPWQYEYDVASTAPALQPAAPKMTLQ